MVFLKSGVRPILHWPSIFSLVSLFLIIPSWTHASGSGTELEQAVAALQKKPNDQGLRERIIRLARENQAGTPEDAKRFIARARAAVNDKENGDAIREYQKALLVAPWLGDGYFNLATLQQTMGDYAGAVTNYKLYLLASPDALDAEKVKERVYELEYRSEKKAGKSKKKVSGTKGGDAHDLQKGFDGSWRYQDANLPQRFKFYVDGKQLVIRQTNGNESIIYAEVTLNGRNFAGKCPGGTRQGGWELPKDIEGALSEDGKMIHWKVKLSGEFPPGYPDNLKPYTEFNGRWSEETLLRTTN